MSNLKNDVKQNITPWKVHGDGKELNYKQLTEQFGLELIDNHLLERFEKITKCKLHPWLKRSIFYAHKGLTELLDAFEKNKPIYLYTGRGPSNDMHLGHTITFLFTKYLQDALKCPVVIQLSDEEKFYFKPELTKETISKFCIDNAKDIIAMGFDPEKTFIFSNFQYGGKMHHLTTNLLRIVNVNQFNKIYGFNTTNSIGQLYWPTQQIVPVFSDAFPHLFPAGSEKALCVVPMGVDQAVYFRCARDYAERLGYPKPVMLCCKFLPGLEGMGDKMSSTGSGSDKSIYLSSDEKSVYDKIKKYAFSGGKTTIAEHREKGGDTTIDTSYQYLSFFEYDDEKLRMIREAFQSGKMSASEIKKILADKLIEILKRHKCARDSVTQRVLEKFMPRL